MMHTNLYQKLKIGLLRLTVSRTHWQINLIIICILTAIYVPLFSGYRFFGLDEHVTHLTGVLYFFDKGLYNNDFDMQIISPILVKNVPHLMLFMLSRFSLIPIHFVYFAAYISIIYLIFILVHKISLELEGPWPAGLLACILLVLFSDNRFLRSSALWIINGAVTARLVAIALHLMCFFLILKKRYLLSVVVACSLFYFHIQNGVYTLLPILATVAFLRKGLKYLLKCLAICLLVASPPLIYLYAKFRPFTEPSARYSLKEIALFREPHHVFPRIELIVIMLFLVFSLVLMIYMKPRSRAIRKEVLYWIFPLLIVYLAGIVFTRYLPIDLVILMLCLRADVFLRIFYFILFSIFLADLSFRHHWHRLVFMMSQAFFLTAVFFLDPLRISSPQIHPPRDAFIDIADYARTHTPKDALFMIPPHLAGFRLYAQRSIVVDFRTLPVYRGSKIRDEWMQRLHDVCNVSSFKKRGFDVNSECEAGFRNLTPKKMRLLCRKYHADYFVAYFRDYASVPDDELMYRNAQFVLMRCLETISSPDAR